MSPTRAVHHGKVNPMVGGTRRLLTLLIVALGLQACDFPGPAPGAGTATPAPQVTGQPTMPPLQTPSPIITPQLLGDAKIDSGGLFHDSRDAFYRNPVGAVVAGTEVTLRLKTSAGDLTAASVRIWNSRSQSEMVVPMALIAPDTWEAKVSTPPEGAALWYRLVARDAGATALYADDLDRDGGRGSAYGSATEFDYLITAYREDFKTPEWLRDAVVYQIFPDRFYNGDPANDKPAGSFIYGGRTVSKQWSEMPTGNDDFFGGDLRGVIEKLDYLQSLGVTAIYFNPVFASPSNHRYDTTDYMHIEPALGDVETFRELVAKARERNIRLILDGVFNHSSSDSIYFDKFSRYEPQGAYESQASPYFGWYNFDQWPQRYKAWYGIDTLPAYSESGAVKDFLFSGPDSVVKRWLGEGIGGWRLDAAEQKSHAFWRELRGVIKAEDSDAVIIGEFWQNAAPWLTGDQWDGVMNYRFKDAVLAWLNNRTRPVEFMAKQLDSIREDYPPQALAASMNIIDSHDTARALTLLGGDKNMLRLMALMQFTWPGLPTIYYGDEAGLEGGRDPDCRRTYPWGGEDKSLVEFYTMLGRTRHETSALRTGSFINLGYSNELDVYTFARKEGESVAVVALNRSDNEQELELPMKDVAADGVTFEDKMKTGATYTVQGGTLKVKVGGRWGALLVGK